MKLNTMLFVKNFDAIKGIEPVFLLRHHATQYKIHVRINIERPYANHIQVFKNKMILDFFFFQNINDSISGLLKNAVCIDLSNVNYSDNTYPFCCVKTTLTVEEY